MIVQRNRSSALLNLLLATWLLWLPAARADIAVVVHPQNPLASLSHQELKKIFLGRLSLFPGGGREIRAIDLPDDHPLFHDFYRQVVELDGVELKRYRAYYLFSGRGRLPVVAASPQAVLRMVTEDPGAIGYLDSKDVTENTRVIMTLRSDESGKPHKESDNR